MWSENINIYKCIYKAQKTMHKNSNVGLTNIVLETVLYLLVCRCVMYVFWKWNPDHWTPSCRIWHVNSLWEGGCQMTLGIPENSQGLSPPPSFPLYQLEHGMSHPPGGVTEWLFILGLRISLREFNREHHKSWAQPGQLASWCTKWETYHASFVTLVVYCHSQ